MKLTFWRVTTTTSPTSMNSLTSMLTLSQASVKIRQARLTSSGPRWTPRHSPRFIEFYGHLLPGSHDEVRERMDAYLLDAAELAIETSEDAA